jgi:hypothetical protein
MCGIGSDACGFLYNKGAVVTEDLVPLDKRDLFKEGAIAPEALSETTNRDADSVVMNSARRNAFDQYVANHAGKAKCAEVAKAG